MSKSIEELMKEEVFKIGGDLELASIYQSGDKYVGVIGFKDQNRSDEAYEYVLVYDPNDDSIKQVHITTAIIDLPETKKESLREIG